MKLGSRYVVAMRSLREEDSFLTIGRNGSRLIQPGPYMFGGTKGNSYGEGTVCKTTGHFFWLAGNESSSYSDARHGYGGYGAVQVQRIGSVLQKQFPNQTLTMTESEIRRYLEELGLYTLFSGCIMMPCKKADGGSDGWRQDVMHGTNPASGIAGYTSKSDSSQNQRYLVLDNPLLPYLEIYCLLKFYETFPESRYDDIHPDILDKSVRMVTCDAGRRANKQEEMTLISRSNSKGFDDSGYAYSCGYQLWGARITNPGGQSGISYGYNWSPTIWLLNYYENDHAYDLTDYVIHVETTWVIPGY